MRVPKALNPRIQKQILMKFGKYEKVYPFERTPSRVVPSHIERPDYVSLTSQRLKIPDRPEIKDHEAQMGMRRSCRLAGGILRKLDNFIKPGITTDAIDEFVHNLTTDAGAYPSPLHYKGFPKSVCTSVNNVAVHGIPDLRPLVDGDIVNVDITVYFKGYHGDCSKTFLVGDVDDKGRELVEVTEECLNFAIQACGPGVPLGVIGSRISKKARQNRLTVLPAFIGHGIGRYFHGPPDIYHIDSRYIAYRQTMLMQPGMTFTIEPVLSHGSELTVILDDGWTVVTEDGSRAAQCEHTVLITDDGVEVLTADNTDTDKKILTG